MVRVCVPLQFKVFGSEFVYLFHSHNNNATKWIPRGKLLVLVAGNFLKGVTTRNYFGLMLRGRDIWATAHVQVKSTPRALEMNFSSD